MSIPLFCFSRERWAYGFKILSQSAGAGNDSVDVSTFQINLAYSLMVRSIENRPLTAMLRMTISFHFFLSCFVQNNNKISF